MLSNKTKCYYGRSVWAQPPFTSGWQERRRKQFDQLPYHFELSSSWCCRSTRRGHGNARSTGHRQIPFSAGTRVCQDEATVQTESSERNGTNAPSQLCWIYTAASFCSQILLLPAIGNYGDQAIETPLLLTRDKWRELRRRTLTRCSLPVYACT